MLTIGFTNHYYTLWSVVDVETWNPIYRVMYIVTHYNYRQNLSMDMEEAKKKIAEMAGDKGYDIDLDLRGDHGKYFTKTRIANLEPYKFSFGKLTGQDIRTSEDVWQLNRAVSQEANPRRKVYARRRLIELGEMVKFSYMERTKEFREGTPEELKKLADEAGMCLGEFTGSFGKEHAFTVEIFRTWCPKKLYEYKQRDKFKGHHFENGKRIDLKLKQIGKVREFEGMYGTSYLVALQDAEGRIYKYMGSTKPDINDEDFTACKATVKHEEYKGQKETKLQRIKNL